MAGGGVVGRAAFGPGAGAGPRADSFGGGGSAQGKGIEVVGGV
jgi:hypothetical protein